MKIAVYGSGGLGGYFGGRLALGGADVHLIARGAHLAALRSGGLTVKSSKGDFRVDLEATDNPSDIGPCDYVLFCVKSFDTESAAARLHPMIHDGTAVISFQNGVDNEEKLAREVGAEHVMGGAAYIFSTILEPGVIAHTGGPARIVFGEMDCARSERADRLLDRCKKAGVDADVSEAIERVLWDKFAFICAQAGMTAAVRLPIGEVRDIEESLATFRAIVQEVCFVAAAEGIDLPADTPQKHAGFAASLEPDSYSSLHYDLMHGRPMELEALHGTVVRRARRHNLPAPVSATIYAILKPWAARNEAAATH